MLKNWKSLWSNYVSALTSMHEQGEKMLDLYFSQSDNLRTEAKKLLKEGLKNAQDAQMSFIKAFEDNLKNFEEKSTPDKG
jgi:hypothetical protein